MSELLVFSILAAAVAVYSVLPEHRQLRRKFAISRKEWGFVLGLGILILLLVLVETYVESANSQFEYFCGAICLPIQVWIEITQILAALGSILIPLRVFLLDETPVRDDHALSILLRNLFSRQEFVTLSALISDCYGTLLIDRTRTPQSSATAEGFLTDDRFLEKYDELDPSLAGRILRDGDAVVILDYPPTAEVMSLVLEQRLQNELPDTLSDIAVEVRETSELAAGNLR